MQGFWMQQDCPSRLFRCTSSLPLFPKHVLHATQFSVCPDHNVLTHVNERYELRQNLKSLAITSQPMFLQKIFTTFRMLFVGCSHFVDAFPRQFHWSAWLSWEPFLYLGCSSGLTGRWHLESLGWQRCYRASLTVVDNPVAVQEVSEEGGRCGERVRFEIRWTAWHLNRPSRFCPLGVCCCFHPIDSNSFVQCQTYRSQDVRSQLHRLTASSTVKVIANRHKVREFCLVSHRGLWAYELYQNC